jgi:hypothetical protein
MVAGNRIPTGSQNLYRTVTWDMLLRLVHRKRTYMENLSIRTAWQVRILLCMEYYEAQIYLVSDNVSYSSSDPGLKNVTSAFQITTCRTLYFKNPLIYLRLIPFIPLFLFFYFNI